MIFSLFVWSSGIVAIALFYVIMLKIYRLKDTNSGYEKTIAA